MNYELKSSAPYHRERKWKFKSTRHKKYARPLILTGKEFIDMWWFDMRRLNPTMTDEEIKEWFSD